MIFKKYFIPIKTVNEYVHFQKLYIQRETVTSDKNKNLTHVKSLTQLDFTLKDKFKVSWLKKPFQEVCDVTFTNGFYFTLTDELKNIR